MIIRQLEMNSFRNYKYAKAEFSPGINVITGKNAQGKTNLIEAIHYLSGAKSFRTRKDGDLIKFECGEAFIEASVEGADRDYRLNIWISRTGRKRITVNGVRKKSASELSGKLCTVLFCPGDLDMIKAPLQRGGVLWIWQSHSCGQNTLPRCPNTAEYTSIKQESCVISGKSPICLTYWTTSI
jgi:recombinational DNA repair ATPase RecF